MPCRLKDINLIQRDEFFNKKNSLEIAYKIKILAALGHLLVRFMKL